MSSLKENPIKECSATKGIPERITGYIKKNGIVFILLLIFLLSSVFVRGFFSPVNLTNVLRQITVVTIIALGATFVIILGHINVSYGSCVALIGCLTCKIMVLSGSLPLALLVGLALGLFIGIVNGTVITWFRIPAFIMTLAVTTIARGIVLLFTDARPITGMNPEFRFIGQGSLGFIPVSVLIMVVLFVISWIMLNKTAFGRHIFATGGNEQAAIASGVKTKSVVRKAFLFDGFMTAVAGIVMMSRLNSGQPASGVGYEFDAITAVVVGGTSLAGGSGSIIGTIIGAVIVGILNNCLNLLNVNTYVQQITKGAIILIAVIVDMLSKRSRR
ncbi:MAG: ABC transporter permease [Treponema sp.]|jgi:inositol transport system permease protein|nr:ABC transporter permease [Treponema sp.]